MPHDLPTDLPTEERDPPNALPRGTLLNDKFRVQRVIGVGGFGIVYLAHDEMSEVDVAIKEYMPASLAGRTKTMQVSLNSQSNAETFALGLKSFWNEARLLAKFRDEPLPLLKVYDAFQANGTAYMVMPVLRGRTAQQLRREMPKPPSERWLRKLLTELLPALERLHAENVYHRDIAPDNIQVDIHGKPVLMDLGAARHVIGNRTQSITAILKPGYAPIEQYGENEKLRQGPWTDIYALGATLHFMLLNQPPANATARLFDVGKPLVAHDLPGCSPPFLRLIDWMLAPRPEDRPQSVAQLRTALNDSDATTRIVAPGAATVIGAPAAAPAAAAARVSAAVPARSPPPPPQSTPQSPLPATLLSETTVIAPPAPRSLPPPAQDSLPPSQASPSTAAEPLALPHPRTGGLPMPKIVAGAAALVVVLSSAAWLWPRQSSPGGTAARPSAASQADTSKTAPAVSFPRPEPAELPATQTAAPPPTSAPAAAMATPAAPPAPIAAPSPQPAPALAAKPPPAAQTVPSDSAAAQTAAVVPSKRASAPAPIAAPAKKPVQVNDKDGALLPRPADPSPQAAAAPPAAPAPPPSPPPAPVAAIPPAPAAATVASPSERCSDKSGIGRRLCIGVVCGIPELHNHPECVAIRRN